MEIAGKVVLITGASSGIGRASARLFAQKGARLALSARSAEKLGQLYGVWWPRHRNIISALTC